MPASRIAHALDHEKLRHLDQLHPTARIWRNCRCVSCMIGMHRSRNFRHAHVPSNELHFQARAGENNIANFHDCKNLVLIGANGKIG